MSKASSSLQNLHNAQFSINRAIFEALKSKPNIEHVRGFVADAQLEIAFASQWLVQRTYKKSERQIPAERRLA